MKVPIQLTMMFAMGAVCLFAQKEPKKLSKAEALNAVVTRVQPEYPAVARQLKLAGDVELEVVITEEGSRRTSGSSAATRY